jgi:hypothetical protein
MCSGLSCRKDTRGLGQCSIECNSDDPCVAKFGKGSSCSTAQHSCVKLCADDSGCPAYTKCDATAHFCYRP